MRRGRPSRTSNCVRRRSSRSTCRCTRLRGSRRRSSIVRTRSTLPLGSVRMGCMHHSMPTGSASEVSSMCSVRNRSGSLVDLASSSEPESRAQPKPKSNPSPEPRAQSLPRLQFIQPDRTGLPALKDMRRCGCPTVPAASWAAPTRLAGASTFAAIARLCRSTTDSSASYRLTSCWRISVRRWQRVRSTSRLATRIF